MMMRQKLWLFKTKPHQRGLITAAITLIVLLSLWWLANSWFHASLIAEVKGQQNIVDRSILALQVTGLLVVGLGTVLAYIVTSRQTQLVQTVQTQEVQLAEREAQYQLIFETTQDALVIRDRDTLKIIDANPAYCRLHQTSRAELIGKTDVLATDLDTYRQYVKIIKRDGQHHWEGAIQRADGTTTFVEEFGTTISYGGKPHLLVTIRDITGPIQIRQLLEQQVAERTHELETLLQISHNLTSTLELKSLLSLILDQVRTVIAYSEAAVFSLAGKAELELLLHEGPPASSQFPPHCPLANHPAYAEVVQAQQPVIIPDVNAETAAARAWQATTGRQSRYTRTWLGVPLMIKQQVSGMLTFGHDRPNYYTPHHAALALAFANQVAIAIENVRLYEQAQTLASLEERRHLARELHDSVSQALYGIALGTRTARMLMDRDPTKLAEPLDYIMNLAEAGLSEMRALIFELRPEVLEAEGLVTAISKQAEALRVRHKLEVVIDIGEEPEVSLAIKEALYRISQEATHNIVKHAKASRVDLRLTNADGLTLEIKDNGQGFDPQQAFPGHLGLHSMQERAEKSGCHFELESGPGHGTTIRVHVVT